MQVEFSPYLCEENIQEEALQLAIKRTVEADKARQEEEYLAKGAETKKKSGRRRKSLAAPSAHAASSLVSSAASLAPSAVSSQSDSDLRLRNMNKPEHG